LLPYSTCGIEGPICERPASRSRVRPQGLVTLSALCSLRRLAGFVSHRQRSWGSPFEAFSSRKAASGFPPEAPTYRWIAAQESTRRRLMWSRQSSVTGLCSFRESLAIKPVFSGPSAGCSLGFRSSRAVGQQPCRDFAQLPLTCLICVSEPTQTAPQSINRLLLGPVLLAAASRRETPDNPRRVLAPVDS